LECSSAALALPDVVPRGGKVPRSVSPPASRGDVSSPSTSARCAPSFYFCNPSRNSRISKQLTKHLLKI